MKKLKKEFMRYIESADVANKPQRMREATEAVITPPSAAFHLKFKTALSFLMLCVLFVCCFTLGMMAGGLNGKTKSEIYGDPLEIPLINGINQSNAEALASVHDLLYLAETPDRFQGNAYYDGDTFSCMKTYTEYDAGNGKRNAVFYSGGEKEAFSEEFFDYTVIRAQKKVICGKTIFYTQENDGAVYEQACYFTDGDKKYIIKFRSCDETFFVGVLERMLQRGKI